MAAWYRMDRVRRHVAVVEVYTHERKSIPAATHRTLNMVMSICVLVTPAVKCNGRVRDIALTH